MKKKVFLVSPEFVKSFSNISDNLSDKYLLTAIDEVQNIHYQKILGSCLLKKLYSLVEDNSIELEENAIYKDLLDISKYFIVYKTIEQIIPIVAVKISNIGANQTNDVNANSLSFNDSMKVAENYHNKADFYALRLQEFLRENQSKIAELDCSCSCNKLAANITSTESSGIWLGGNRGKGNNITYRLRDKYENN